MGGADSFDLPDLQYALLKSVYFCVVLEHDSNIAVLKSLACRVFSRVRYHDKDSREPQHASACLS